MQLERVLEEALAGGPEGTVPLPSEGEWADWLEHAIEKTPEYVPLSLEKLDALCTPGVAPRH